MGFGNALWGSITGTLAVAALPLEGSVPYDNGRNGLSFFGSKITPPSKKSMHTYMRTTDRTPSVYKYVSEGIYRGLDTVDYGFQNLFGV